MKCQMTARSNLSNYQRYRFQDPGSIPGGGPKRFHDSFNIVFYIVGECISCAADTHLATDLAC